MSAKKSAEVVIDGRVYTLSGYEEEAYLQKVAAYINGKIDEFNQMENFKRLSQDTKATLLELNIADDFFKAKDQIEKFEREMEQKEKEIYDLKHDLISYQVKIEDLENSVHSLEEERRELLLNKSKLEASLEDVLLGSVSAD